MKVYINLYINISYLKRILLIYNKISIGKYKQVIIQVNGVSLIKEIIINNNKDINQIDKQPLKDIDNSLDINNYIFKIR